MALMYITHLLTLLLLLSACNASFRPSAIPIVLKSPYLSTWVTGNNSLNSDFFHFWTTPIVAWTGYAVVDNVTYLTMGNAYAGSVFLANQTTEYQTVTSTVVVFAAGPVSLTYTFIDPLWPNDVLRQSIPFSYLHVIAESTDGLPHSVVMYSDVTGEWLATDNTLQMTWDTMDAGGFVTHKLRLLSQTPATEKDDRIQDGAVYFSGTGRIVAYQTGEDTVLRPQFIQNHTLLNTTDHQYRQISDRWPVFAFSVDMGQVLVPSQPAIFSIGHAREIIGTLSSADRFAYFASQYSPDDLPAFVMGDFEHAVAVAQQLDNRVAEAAQTISDTYFDVVALSIRQAFASTELTIGKNLDSWDTQQPMLFVKGIGIAEKAVLVWFKLSLFAYRIDQTTNPLDALYAMWPIFHYLSPALGFAALETVFNAAQTLGTQYCPSNLGFYPQASGPSSVLPDTPIDSTGAALLLALDAAQQTGDNSQLTRYFDLLNKWAQYLVVNASHPDSNNANTADTYLSPLLNQTNLALKGILGIAAMSRIANLTGHADQSAQYSQIAQNFTSRWAADAMTSDGSHLALHYGDDGSWGLAYNSYMDRLLALDIVPPQIYIAQNNFYRTQLQTYGLPLNMQTTNTSSVWTLWAAALAPDDLRGEMIDLVAKYISAENGAAPLSDAYDTSNASPLSGYAARPHVGGHAAILALPDSSRPLGSATPSTSFTPSSATKSVPAHVLLFFGSALLVCALA